MNIINKMKLTLITGLLLTSCGIFADNPIRENEQSQQVTQCREITFVNNIDEIINFYNDIFPSELKDIEQALPKVKVYINGHEIAPGQSLKLDIKNNIYEIAIVSMAGKILKPVLVPHVNLAKRVALLLLAPFADVDIKFEVDISANNDDTIEVLFPFLAWLDKLQSKAPSTTSIRYISPLTLHLKIEDLK